MDGGLPALGRLTDTGQDEVCSAFPPRVREPRGERGFEIRQISRGRCPHHRKHRRLLETIGNRPPAEAEAVYYGQAECTALAA